MEHVDGVHCSYNLASRMVVVGTGLVGNKERDNFKLSGEYSTAALEEQVRKRPMFQHFDYLQVHRHLSNRRRSCSNRNRILQSGLEKLAPQMMSTQSHHRCSVQCHSSWSRNRRHSSCRSRTCRIRRNSAIPGHVQRSRFYSATAPYSGA